MTTPESLTERQRKWFAAVQDGLARDTGKSLAEWVEIALACPHTAPRRRQAWLKAEHGLGQNRAMLVLNTAFPPASGWSDPDGLAATLWADPAARAIHDAVRAVAAALPGVVVGQRKGFTAFSRQVQFAAVKPARDGAVLGLAVDPGADPALLPAAKQGWSERLSSRMPLADPAAVTPRVAALLRAAWERS